MYKSFKKFLDDALSLTSSTRGPDSKMSERSGLPPGWKTAESDGRLYYYSAYSNVVVWEKPTGPPPPPPPPPGPPPRSPLVSEYDSQEEDIFR